MGNCSFCGGEMAVRFSACDHLRPADPTLYQVEWCTPCGYGRLRGSFDIATVRGFYPERSTPRKVGISVSRPPAFLERLCDRLAQRLDRGAELHPREIARTLSLTGHEPTLCDVGCGTGRMMRLFAASGFDVTGIDPDPEARKVARQYGPVLAGTAEALPDKIRGSQFSVVLLSHVLERCIDPVAALGNVKRLLAPGGTAVIEVPNCASTGFNRSGPGWCLTDVPRNLHFFTRASLDRTLEAAGFKVVRRINQGYARQMSPEWLRTEQAIREKMGMEAGQGSAWGLLARTAFSSVDEKYDSIRVHAIHDQGTEEE